MADSHTLAATIARIKTLAEIDAAIAALVNAMLEPDDVVNQYLADEGWTMRVKSAADRQTILQTLNAARAIHEGRRPEPTGRPRMNFGARRLRT